MQKNYADLHIHTYYSDGSFSPEEVIDFAVKVGLRTIAITDHDCVKAYTEAIPLANSKEIELIPGIELSAGVGNEEFHVLGYFIDWREKVLLDRLEEIAQARQSRFKTMIEKLNDLGLIVEYDDVLNFIGRGTQSRLHLANYLVKKGIVKNIFEVFKKYLGIGKPAFENINVLNLKQSIELILSVKGIPVIAHPGLIKEELVSDMVSMGLKGIEVYHGSHNPQIINHCLGLAQKYHLLITGGSDCHGLNKDEIYMGKVKLDYNYVADLKRKIKGENINA
jgi:predicted metal-dependent phosphoesterase TrpH